MILRGLPRHFDLFFIYVTHSNKELEFLEFKTELHSFQETLKYRNHSSSDDVMKLNSSFLKAMKNDNCNGRDVSCFTCGGMRHLTKICPNDYNKGRNLWCSYWKSTTNWRESCHYKRRDSMKKAADVEERSFAFKINDYNSRKTTVPTEYFQFSVLCLQTLEREIRPKTRKRNIRRK